VGRDSVIGIATRYGLDGPGTISRWGGTCLQRKQFSVPCSSVIGKFHCSICFSIYKKRGLSRCKWTSQRALNRKESEQGKKGCKFARGVKAKRHKTNGRKTRPWCTAFWDVTSNSLVEGYQSVDWMFLQMPVSAFYSHCVFWNHVNSPVWMLLELSCLTAGTWRLMQRTRQQQYLWLPEADTNDSGCSPALFNP
jgi:hypothetical protein